jgi:aminoglycoside/choline kinase family phosphotransferase
MRTALRQAFLEKEGLKNAALHPLPVDASKRCYFRLPKALLMDAPPPHENTQSFQKMAELLSTAGLSVPQVHAADHENGFLLVEDFGEMTFRKALECGIPEPLLYGEAVNSLVHLHQTVLENKAQLPTYSLDLFLTEVNIFLEWYGLPVSLQAEEEFKELWIDAYQQQPPIPQSIVMRDVLVDNLLWLPKRSKFSRCGFIDFQDGVWGPVTYDLVSLLEDARRDIRPQFEKDMVDLYLKNFPDLDPQAFWENYTLWGAQRSTKILGIFSRLAKRDGKNHYLRHIPRVKRILENALSHPTLRSLRYWFREHLYA